MAKPHEPRDEEKKAKKKPGGQQHQNPPRKTSTEKLSAIRRTRRAAEAASSRGRATMDELVRFADVLGRRLSNAVGKDDPQPAPPIERPPEPIPEPHRDPDTPQPVKSPPPEPVPELPTNATSAAIATAA